MAAETRTCRGCGEAMQFRLGEFHCPSCGGIESAQPYDPRQREFAPPQLIAQREDAAVATKTAYALPQAQLESLRSTRDYRKLNEQPEKYDPSPRLEIEKMILFGIYLGRVTLTLVLALSNGKDLLEAGVAADAAGAILIGLGLMLPVVPVKAVIAYLSLLAGGLSFLIILRTWFLWIMLGGVLSSRGGFVGALIFKDVADAFLLVLILSLAAAALELWLASVLFRDMHRLQVLREK